MAHAFLRDKTRGHEVAVHWVYIYIKIIYIYIYIYIYI
jgi:hypothetical protein